MQVERRRSAELADVEKHLADVEKQLEKHLADVEKQLEKGLHEHSHSFRTSVFEWLEKEECNSLQDLFDIKEELEKNRRTFDAPEPYDEEKLKQHLVDPSTVEVRVFTGTKSNIRFAKFRAKYPHLSRKEIRRIMKDKKQDKFTIDED